MKTTIGARQPEQNRALDWVTALSPVLLMAFVYYRWAVLGLAVASVGGYLAVAALWRKWDASALRVLPAVLSGVLVTLCLPATTPVWVAALAGGVTACAALLPALLSRILPFTCPMLVAPLVGFLAVRWVFPALVTRYTLPVQWAADVVASATPLAHLGNPETGVDLTRLYLGLHAGAVGEGCVPVLVLAAAYLAFRRRLRWVAPVAMLASVLVLSWPVFGAPLESLLSGGVLLAALVLADETYAPAGYGPQAMAGVLAGVLVVLLRGVAGVDGSAIAVVLTVLLCPVYGWIFRRFVGKKEPPPVE